MKNFILINGIFNTYYSMLNHFLKLPKFVQKVLSVLSISLMFDLISLDVRSTKRTPKTTKIIFGYIYGKLKSQIIKKKLT